MTDPATACEPTALQQIYRSTRGYCHGCRRKLAFTGYARTAVRGAWDIDARALRPACTACLRGHVTRDRSAPRRPAYASASAAAPRSVGCRHTLLGGLLGAFMLGPWGALLGGLLGAEVDEG
jgi:hypothetical protein